jgi:phage baseplate assembly protein W
MAAPRGELKRIGVRYSDFKVDVDEHPVSKDLALSVNADSVKRSVRNLLLTGTYERRFRPQIGSGLQKYLFENVTPVTAQLIRQSILLTLSNFEPRARVVSVRVKVSPDQNAYEATVKFGIENLPEVVEVSQLLRRVR